MREHLVQFVTWWRNNDYQNQTQWWVELCKWHDHHASTPHIKCQNFSLCKILKFHECRRICESLTQIFPNGMSCCYVLLVVDSTFFVNSEHVLTLWSLECKGNYSVTWNNVKLVHWPLRGGLLVQQLSAQSPL